MYRARDTRLHRDIALKILPELFALDPDRLARFEREAQVLASLKHPNIGTIYGLEEANGVRALVLELVDGETLQELIALSPKPSTGLPLDETLKIARQIGEALEAAHEHGVIHRDLKPSNIKITPDGVVKVLDFGLAKALSKDSAAGDLSISPTLSLAATRAGVILGTAAYMSPEQAKGKPVDKRTDIWAFGCVLYEMLTGRRAFEGEDISETLAAILRAEPDWNALPETTPAAIHKLLRRCLEKDRKERTPDIAVARFELKDALTAPRIEPGAATGFATRRRRERLAWIVAAASLVVAMVAVPTTMYVRRTASEPVVTRLDVVTPPTTEFSFALSPDGRQVAFVATAEGGSRLWLRPLDQVTAQPLAGTEGASYPFWAPDSRAIGFFANGRLKRVDLAGGATQVLAEAPQARGGTWNRDGVIIFAPSSFSALMRVAATGGTPTPVTRVAADQGSHRWPQFLPDGRLLFLMANGQPQTHGVYVASMDGGEPTRVLAGETAALYAPPGYLLRVSQGVLVAQGFDAANATVAGEPIPVAQDVGGDDGLNHSAFSVSAAGVLAHRAGATARRQLVWVDRAGKVLGAVGPAVENGLGNPELAPDGQRVAIARTVSGNADVWLIDAGRGMASRFTFDATIDNSPVWSPNGSQVVFRSARKGGVYDLFAKPANGATDEQPLLVTSQDKAPLDWLPDGRFLLYSTQDPKTASDLWALPLTGERKVFPVVQTGFDEIEGQVSPDGRWLAYASNESGRYEIYIRPFPEPGGKWQVSTAGGVQPRWRRDGKELFYVAPDARLMAVPVRVASDARTVEAGVPVALLPTRLVSGANIAAAGFNARAQYAVAPDGRFLMNIAADDAITLPITIVLNWEAGLKK